jgi:galactose mutarotase-like enzyme
VAATSDKPVPLCYGFHPYLQLPGVPRAEWVVGTPALRHLEVDARGLPTGVGTDQPVASEPLGDKAFDDGYDKVPDGAVFAVSGAGRRIEVRFCEGYPAAQIFAPPGEDLICFEPMAAPTDALIHGGYATAEPGRVAVAEFSISV